MIRVAPLFCLLFATSAHAAFWDRPPSVGHFLGISLVANLGPAADRARFGVALDATTERIWQERPYWYDGPNQVTPAIRAAAQIGWTHPVVWTEATAQAGVSYPSAVYDGGYIHGLGGLAGLGLGMATDGWAGPVLTGTVVGPWSQARIESGRQEGAWHAPRLSIGPQLQMNCCLTYY